MDIQLASIILFGIVFLYTLFFCECTFGELDVSLTFFNVFTSIVSIVLLLCICSMVKDYPEKSKIESDVSVVSNVALTVVEGKIINLNYMSHKNYSDGDKVTLIKHGGNGKFFVYPSKYTVE